LHICFAFRIFV